VLTTLQGYCTNRATHVLPREARNPGFLEGCKCQQNGRLDAFRGRDDARFPGPELTTRGLPAPFSVDAWPNPPQESRSGRRTGPRTIGLTGLPDDRVTVDLSILQLIATSLVRSLPLDEILVSQIVYSGRHSETSKPR